MRIFTIGYEGATVGEFLAALQKAGVERVISTFAALPPKAGLSPSRRSAHRWKGPRSNISDLKALGTPAENQRGSGGGRRSEASADRFQFRSNRAISADARARSRNRALYCA